MLYGRGGSLSPVLISLGVPIDYSIGTLRLIVGPSTTDKEVGHAFQFIAEESMRQINSVG